MKKSALYSFRIMAGGYLVYLGYTLAAAFVKGESDMDKWMLLFPLLFLIAGSLLVIFSFLGLRRDKMKEK